MLNSVEPKGNPTTIADRVSSVEGEDYVHERFFRLSDARVIWNSEGSGMTDNQLLEQCAVISEPQLRPNEVNDVVIVDPVVRPEGLRPPYYGRAALLEVRPGYWVDVKGVGVCPGATPRATVHATGVLPLNKAFEELTREWIVSHALSKQSPSVSTVRSLALLTTGYRARDRDKAPQPAALLVREAHHRRVLNDELSPFGSDRFRFCMWVELYLRQFGITSSTPTSRYRIVRDGKDIRVYQAWRELTDYGRAETTAYFEGFAERYPLPLEADLPNIQTTRTTLCNPMQGTLVDFGQYQSMGDDFMRPIVLPAYDRPFSIGSLIAHDPTSPWFQPDPKLRFRNTEDRKTVPHWIKASLGLPDLNELSELKLLSLAAAAQLTSGHLDPDTILGALRAYAGSVACIDDTRPDHVWSLLGLTPPDPVSSSPSRSSSKKDLHHGQRHF